MGPKRPRPPSSASISTAPEVAAAEPFKSYVALIEKVESFLGAVRSKYGNFIKCQPGCSRCCLVDISIFQVEAEYLRKEYEQLRPADQNLINKKARHSKSPEGKGENEECVLLIDGKCALYSHRPIICRTHGYPVYKPSIEKDGCQISACELNFAGFDLIGLDPAFVLNLNLLEATLASINHVFMKAQNLNYHGRPRSFMEDIFLSFP